MVNALATAEMHAVGARPAEALRHRLCSRCPAVKRWRRDQSPQPEHGYAREFAAPPRGDRYDIAQSAVHALVAEGQLPKAEAAKAVKLYKLDAEKPDPTAV